MLASADVRHRCSIPFHKRPCTLPPSAPKELNSHSTRTKFALIVVCHGDASSTCWSTPARWTSTSSSCWRWTHARRTSSAPRRASAASLGSKTALGAKAVSPQAWGRHNVPRSAVGLGSTIAVGRVATSNPSGLCNHQPRLCAWQCPSRCPHRRLAIHRMLDR